MLNRKLHCPICNQEFPAYDQRGFRNAGFTSHHNRCLERHEQQQIHPHQRNKQSCRAVRFAMALKRRLLPAQPTSSAPMNISIEPHTSNSTPLGLPELGPGAGSASSLSFLSPPIYDSHAHRAEPTTIVTPTIPSQALPQPLLHHRTPRQRHAWNHWKTGKEVRRSTYIATKDMPRPQSRSPPIHIPTSPLSTTISNSAVAQTFRATSTNANDTIKTSAFPLLTTITIMDSTTALIIPQATPTQPSHTLVNSPILHGSPPLSFISMLTTLPLESTPRDQPTSVSVSSANRLGNINNNLQDLVISRDITYSATDLDPMANDWMAVADASGTKNDPSSNRLPEQQRNDPMASGQMAAGDYSHARNVPFLGCPPYRDHARTDHYLYTVNSHFLTQQMYDPHVHSSLNNRDPEHPRNMKTTPLNPSSTAHSIHLPISTNQVPMVAYCSYCLPQNGLHDPSCSLLEYIMAEILRNSPP